MPASRRRFAPVRELEEETGVTGRSAGPRWDCIIPAPAIFTEVIHLYLARDLEIGAAKPDADEELELKWLPLDEAINHAPRGRHGMTARRRSALWRAQYQLQM